MEKKVCCFTGSRPQNLSYGFDEEHPYCIHLKKMIFNAVELLINKYGVEHFISGMALGTDQWAAEAVLELKKKYPAITLEAAIPCETQAVKWSVEQRERYFKIIQSCNVETLLQKAYTNDCMRKRNQYMVEKCNYVIAVWVGSSGGTENTVKSAQKLCKPIYCINPETFEADWINID